MTYLDLIKQVILTNRSPKGMSLAAIKKGVEAIKNDGKGIKGPHVTCILKQAVEDNILTKCNGQRYKVTPEQRKEIKAESPMKTPSPKKASKPKKKKAISTAPKVTKPKKTKAKKGPAGAAKTKKA